MIPVNSSRLLQIGWQPTNETQDIGNLHVVFSDQSSGFYEGVPLDVFREGRDSAPSKGRWLHTSIIQQGYPFYKMPPPGTMSGEPTGPAPMPTEEIA
jgi:hypothetical protein